MSNWIGNAHGGSSIVRPRTWKHTAAFLGALTLLDGTVNAADNVLYIAKCSEPKGSMITLLNNQIQLDDDKIDGQNYTLVFYRPDNAARLAALVVAEGPNNLNEQGTYRIYGNEGDPILEIDINYDRASWRYSLFAKEKLLYIHGTKAGVIGNPTANLLVAECK